jgi:methionyl-tRNA formyltransferase
VLQPKNLKSADFIAELSALSPDLIVIVAFRVLPVQVFTMPSRGSVNLHASLLPKYRGAAPINRAVMNGDTQTGVTTFFLQEKVDTGSIIMQEKTDIGENEDAGSVHDRLAEIGSELLLNTVELIAKGDFINLIKQDDSLACSAPKIFKEDCVINWNRPAKNIHDHIRGLSPYPGAFTKLESKVFKIYSSRVSEVDSDSAPGTVTIVSKKLYVNTSDKLLELLNVQPEGKRKMSASEFLAGHPDIIGQKFSI